MTFISLALNILVFFLLFNWSYLQKRRTYPDYPQKPLTQFIVFPMLLGIAYTVLVDAYKGIFYYQMILFLVVAGVLFWKLFGFKKNGS